MPQALRPRGFSLLELLTVLTLLGVLASLAAPRLDRRLLQLRAEAALDGVAADLYHARMLAVRDGAPVEVRFSAERRCVRGYRIRPVDDEARSVTRSLGAFAQRVCIRHSGTGRLTFNSRGVLRPTGIALWTTAGGAEHRLTVSAAGRILRRP